MIDQFLPLTSVTVLHTTYIQCRHTLVHLLPRHLLPCEHLPKYNNLLQAPTIAWLLVLLMTACRLQTSEIGCPSFLTNAHHTIGNAYIHRLLTRITDKVRPISQDRANSRAILPIGIQFGSMRCP
jgi:hypothetical protein